MVVQLYKHHTTGIKLQKIASFSNGQRISKLLVKGLVFILFMFYGFTMTLSVPPIGRRSDLRQHLCCRQQDGPGIYQTQKGCLKPLRQPPLTRFIAPVRVSIAPVRVSTNRGLVVVLPQYHHLPVGYHTRLLYRQDIIPRSRPAYIHPHLLPFNGGHQALRLLHFSIGL